MPQFSRRSVVAATDTIASWSHAEIDRFTLKYGLENVAVGYSRLNKANALGGYLTRNPEAVDEDGANLVDSIVTGVVNLAAGPCRGGYPQAFLVGEHVKRYGMRKLRAVLVETISAERERQMRDVAAGLAAQVPLAGMIFWFSSTGEPKENKAAFSQRWLCCADERPRSLLD